MQGNQATGGMCMTHDIARLKDAFRRSGLSLLGYSFERAMQTPLIRKSLACSVKAQDRATTKRPDQPALI